MPRRNNGRGRGGRGRGRGRSLSRGRRGDLQRVVAAAVSAALSRSGSRARSGSRSSRRGSTASSRDTQGVYANGRYVADSRPGAGGPRNNRRRKPGQGGVRRIQYDEKKDGASGPVRASFADKLQVEEKVAQSVAQKAAVWAALPEFAAPLATEDHARLYNAETPLMIQLQTFWLCNMLSKMIGGDSKSKGLIVTDNSTMGAAHIAAAAYPDEFFGSGDEKNKHITVSDSTQPKAVIVRGVTSSAHVDMKDYLSGAVSVEGKMIYAGNNDLRAVIPPGHASKIRELFGETTGSGRFLRKLVPGKDGKISDAHMGSARELLVFTKRAPHSERACYIATEKKQKGKKPADKKTATGELWVLRSPNAVTAQTTHYWVAKIIGGKEAGVRAFQEWVHSITTKEEKESRGSHLRRLAQYQYMDNKGNLRKVTDKIRSIEPKAPAPSVVVIAGNAVASPAAAAVEAVAAPVAIAGSAVSAAAQIAAAPVAVLTGGNGQPNGLDALGRGRPRSRSKGSGSRSGSRSRSKPRR